MAHGEHPIPKENIDILALTDQTGLASGTGGRIIQSGTTLLFDNGSDWIVIG